MRECRSRIEELEHALYIVDEMAVDHPNIRRVIEKALLNSKKPQLLCDSPMLVAFAFTVWFALGYLVGRYI